MKDLIPQCAAGPVQHLADGRADPPGVHDSRSDAHERSAAAGVRGVARSVGASISPLLATVLVGSTGLMSVPFFLAGGFKIVYDVLLYRAFSGGKPGRESK